MRVGQVTLLHEYLERATERAPQKTALICGEERLSWREIDEQSNRLAHALIRLGVARGDRVLVYLDNSLQSCLAVFGILKAGAVFSPINPQTKSEKLAYLLNDCRAKVIIADALLARIYTPALAQASHLRHALIVQDAAKPLPVSGFCHSRSLHARCALITTKQ